MNSYQIKSQENGLLVSGLRDFSLPQILDCGQCFRWTPVDGDETHWQGFAMGRKLSIEQQGENCFFFSPCSVEEFEQIWTPYFDLDCDYAAIKRTLCCDPIMREATGYAPGIRVLKQDGWETLCTFIISQNNNIKRIRGIVERFCQLFGEERNGGFDFPTPQRLASATLEDLAPLRAGFRAKYLLDAAQKVASAEVDLSLIPQLPYEEASALLQKIHGVGPKVADCTLLFGFYRLEAFPLDVWMKRAMKTLYPQGLPSEILPYRGIAQQYLFHYSRMHPELFE
ncbi:MAG: DNA-3-methyladenine glycosylase 2 [Ruminococcaceae bacterium]|nr:DNA-3-methyladenine glycosylase 2 [Oscillospiraceae bacterium]